MISLRGVTLRRGTKVVLEQANLTLQPGEKVGLVGRNGAGKSSLFALLAGRLHADAGDVEMPPRWQLAEVAQEMPETAEGATAFVLQGDVPLQRAQALLAQAEGSGDGNAIAQAHLALEEAGAFDARARAQSLLLGLGFRVEQLEAPVDSFSGGWRMRLQLARALMCPADLLLLDEPTNHLDLDALVWLESWLERFEGTLIVISHDREFLDAICKVIVHHGDARLMRYTGNYTAFEEMRAERLEQAQAAFARQQEKIAHLQRFIDRFKAKATKARQAQSRVKALARMERLAPVLTASDFEFEFREPESLPNPMLVLDELCCGYRAAQSETPGTDAPAAHDADASAPDPAGGDIVVVRKVSRSVLAGQRIGILGANGQGKSTLVKTIARVLPALGGRITEGKGLAIGYFAQQELDVLRPDEGPLQHMVRLARDLGPAAREQELRDFLGRFRFTGDMVAQPVGSLSGGEKARLVLAMLVWQRPNLLLLDEPTNHLDLDTRQALSIALNEFEGTLMLVSHDRALLREVCDEFWLVTQGGVQDFDGDLDDYQRWLLEVSRAVARGQPAPLPPRPGFASAPAAPPTTAASRPKGQAGGAAPAPAAPSRTARDERQAGKIARARLAEATRPLRTEIQRIDERLTRLAAEREEVQTLLASGGTRAEDYAELGRRLAHIDAEVQKLEERWLEAQAELEEMQAAGG